MGQTDAPENSGLLNLQDEKTKQVQLEFVPKRHKFHDGRAKSDISLTSFAQSASE
jgi:hypothetical protein